MAVLGWRENRLSLYELSEQRIEGDGNCQVILHTLAHFLDCYVYFKWKIYPGRVEVDQIILKCIRA